MLSLFRNNLQSFFVKFIVAIVSLVMVGFGVASFTDQGVNVIATVDGVDIKLEKYQRAYEQAENDVKRKYPQNSDDMIKSLNLKNRVLQQLINNALLIKSAEKNGIVVTDQELADEIITNPAFQTDNRFDQIKYNDLLKQNRTNNMVYEEDLRKSLVTRKFFSFINSGVTVSQKYLENELREGETVTEVDYVELNPSKMIGKIKVSKEEIKQYHNAHKTEFMQKSRYLINFIKIELEDVNDKVNVRDKEISKYYQKNKDSEFSTKDSFKSRHILISSSAELNSKADLKARKKANSIYQKILKNKRKFASLAKKYSDDPGSKSNGGNLGWVEKGTFIKEFEIIISRLNKNEISKPFKSPFGYHIVNLLGKKKAEVVPLEKAKDEIVAKIKKVKAQRKLKRFARKIEDEIAQQTFSVVAQSYNKKILKSEPFDTQSVIPGIGSVYQLYQEIKSKSVKDSGSYQYNGDDGYLMYEIVEVIAAYPKALKDVEKQVTSLVKRDKQKIQSENKIKELANNVKTHSDFKKLAPKYKLKVKNLKFKRIEADPSKLFVSQLFINEVLKLKKNQVKHIADANRNYIVYLKNQIKNSAKLDGDKIKYLEGAIKSQKSQIILGGILREYKQNTEVIYNDSMLQALEIFLTS